MLYGILTEWNAGDFNGNAVAYENVSDLAFLVRRLAPAERFTGSLRTPDGITVTVAVDGEFVYFRYGKYDLGYELTRDGAVRLPF